MNMQEKNDLRNSAAEKSVTEKLEALSPTAFDSLLESEAAKKFFHKRTLASPLIVPFVRGGQCYERQENDRKGKLPCKPADSFLISGKEGTPAYGIQPKVAPGEGDFPGGDAA